MAQIPHSRKYLDGASVEPGNADLEDADLSITDELYPAFLDEPGGVRGLGGIAEMIAYASDLRSTGGSRLYRLPDGTLKEVSLTSGESGFTIVTSSFPSIEAYERKRLLVELVMKKLNDEM